LTEVCGVNDGNLHVLEELLETRIDSRGNELYLSDESSGKREILVKVLDELEEYVHQGQTPGPDLVRAIYRSLTENGEHNGSELRDSGITIGATGQAVYPRNHNQAAYVSGMSRYEMIFCIGPAGTGKTYLAIAHALSEILSRTRRKLVLTRPVVEAGEKLGFLPGDLAQKINPYLKPLYDAMESLAPAETIQKLEENRVIEIAPLAYMRGRSLNNSYIILDEAQNTTKEQMKMFLTRLGEGSKAIVTGDITQIDLPKREDSGLLHAMDILNGIDEIQFNYFSARDVVRNPLVRKIIEAYEGQSK
jgi:phosphate starvation-inducible PhoH-like protein